MGNQSTIRDFRVVLVAGVQQVLPIAGDFIAIYTATSPFQLTVDSNAPVTRQEGDRWKYDLPYSSITLESSVNQTVVIVCGFGYMDQNLAGVSVTAAVTYAVANNCPDVADVTILPTAAAILSGAAATKMRVQLKSPITNSGPVRINGTGVATGGVMLYPGEGVELETSATIYGYNPDAANNQTIQITELHHV
jgi:hypothetical protein